MRLSDKLSITKEPVTPEYDFPCAEDTYDLSNRVHGIYSSARGGEKNRMTAARQAIPKIGKRYPAKSSALVASKFAFCATTELAKLVTVSMGTIFISEVRTKAGEATVGTRIRVSL